MTMRIYKSTDASAPSLQGVVGGAYSSGWAAGSLVELLRQILVVGYGSKTAAGWSLAFNATSQASFRQGAGCQFYLQVLDDGSLTAGAREAAFTGYEVMTSASAGTNPFPTGSQVSGFLKFRKSDTADTTQRQWICFADNRTFYLFSWPQTSTSYYAGMAFGDFYSYYSGDAYNCMAIGRTTSAAIDTTTNETLDMIQLLTGTAQTGHYMARGYTQLGTSVNFLKEGRFFDTSTTAPATMAATGGTAFPNPTDGKMWMSRCYVVDQATPPTQSIRGFLRGFWVPQSVGSGIPLEYTINGSGGLSGRTFKVLGLRTGNSANGRYCMETSDTWD